MLALALVAAQAAAPVSVDYSIANISPGSWRYAPVQGGSAASFVDATGTIRLVVQCNRSTRRIALSRIATAPAPALQLWTSSGSRSLPARWEGKVFRVTAELAANDSILDAALFSRGRFAVAMSGAPALVVPTWAEPARAIEDCRS